jgi:hypothetical protein
LDLAPEVCGQLLRINIKELQAEAH